MCVYLCVVHASDSKYSQSSPGDSDLSLELVVRYCEPPKLGVGNQTQVHAEASLQPRYFVLLLLF